MSIQTLRLNVGRDSVVIGRVTGNVGDGSVVIGPTDQFGNTIINKPMAVGRGAFAGPGSIAIGAGASAGAPILINQLADAVETTGDDSVITEFNKLVAEFKEENRKPDSSTVKKYFIQPQEIACFKQRFYFNRYNHWLVLI